MITKKRFKKGIILTPDDVGLDSIEGEIKVGATSKKVQVYLDGGAKNLVTETGTAALTGKTIDADLNTITNIEVADLKAGVLDTDLTTVSTSDDTIPSAKATKALIDSRFTTASNNLNSHIDQAADAHDASAISVFPNGNLTSTTVQQALGELQGDINTNTTAIQTNATNLADHLADTVDSHDASSISVAPAGNLTSTDAQGAFSELQGDINTINTTLADKVTGPGSSFDERVARFDGTTGKLIQNSAATLDDAGNLSGLNSVLSQSVSALKGFGETETVDSTTTGTAAVLTPVTSITVLTNASLVSISQIVLPTNFGTQLTLINRTGVAISINDNATPTTGQKIYTGTKAALTLADQASISLKLNNSTLTWNVVGGSGSGAGSAGASDLDTMFQQTFDSAVLGDFTQTGLSLDAVAPLNGSKSAKLTHQSAVSQSFKQTVAVPLKYRGQAMTMALVAKSAASLGNVTILFRDETNNVDLQSSQQISATSTAQTFQFGVTIPATCLSFSYTITALPQAGTPVTYIDDVAFRSYFMGTAVEGQTQTTYVVPKITTQYLARNFARDIGVQAFTGALSSDTANGVLSYDSATGVYTALKPCTVDVSFSANQKNANSFILVTINFPSATPVGTSDAATAGTWVNVAGTANLTTGQSFNIGNLSGTSAADRTYVVATAYETETKIVTSTDIVPAKAMSGNASFSVPKITSQSSLLNAGTSFNNTVISGALSSSSGSGVYSYNATTGEYTILKSGQITMNYSFASNGAAVTGVIRRTLPSSLDVAIDTTGAAGVVWATASFTGQVTAGEVYVAATTGATISQKVSLTATATESETKTFAVAQNGLVQEADTLLFMNGGTFVAGTQYSPTTTVTSRGSGITYSAGRFTANTEGLYVFSAFGSLVAAGNGTLNFELVSNGVTKGYGAATGTASGQYVPLTASIYMLAGDYVVLSNIGTTNLSDPGVIISKPGTLKQVNVNTNQKAQIATSELRFEGATARGTGAESFVVRFTNQAKIRGDAFTVVNDAATGTVITMKKAGKLDIGASLYLQTSSFVAISKNQAARNVDPTIQETVAGEFTTGTNDIFNLHYSGLVNVGDVFRVISNGANPSPSTTNQLNLLFQEQEVQVSVSNTLPQFSESDLVVKAAGNAGQALTANVTDIPFVTTSDTTNGAWNGSQFTVPENGIYSFSGYVYESGSAQRAIHIYVGGVALARTSDFLTASAVQFSYTGYFTKGQVVSLRETASNATLVNDPLYHYLNITKPGKPNVTGVNVTPFINIPQPTSQSSFIQGSGTFASDVAIASALTSSTGSGLYSYNPTSGIYTVLKSGNFTLNTSIASASATFFQASIRRGVDFLALGAAETSTSGSWAQASWAGILQVGESFYFAPNSGSSASFRCSVLAEALSDQILTAPETFSTDTAALVYAPSSQYTIATLANAPVGTFITYTMAAGTFTRTQTTTAPAQSISDMNSNGILLYSRKYDAASTASQPAIVAIQIGRGLKGTSLGLYKSSGKSVAGNLDYASTAAAFEIGAPFKDYNESTGILLVDVAYCHNNTTTGGHLLAFSDGTTATSGYLVVNASKNPSLVGITSATVAASAQNTAGSTFTGTPSTFTYDSAKYFDTHGALNTATGVFTCPSNESGFYQVEAGVLFASVAYGVGQSVYINAIVNGVTYRIGSAVADSTTASFKGVNGSRSFFLAAGQTAFIQIGNERGSTALASFSGFNYFTITKTGK